MLNELYQYDRVKKEYSPALYPGDKIQEGTMPDDIRTDVTRLNSIIETKYTREFLKICAYYNKMFPSLKATNFTNSFYNVPAFTALEQERSDTGVGMSKNYLKTIINQIVSRLGTVTFAPKLLADVPTLEYIMYKDEVERLLRQTIRNSKLNNLSLECFHDAAVIGYSHVIVDPITKTLFKANDYEVGYYDTQFNKDKVQQLLYRDYAFPVTELVPYLEDCDEELVERVQDSVGNAQSVDFRIYFDCTQSKVFITIKDITLPEIDYPYDYVQMATFRWDVGFAKVTSTSLFDLLYPVQRELNKINAKIQQLIRLYKGAIPVFNNDVDLAMKSITNGSGECLYVDSTRPIDSLMTVINPTPLDPALDAAATQFKSDMFELAGLQQISFNMENMRSAASVIAVDQMRDTVFQAQMAGIANFIKDMFKLIVNSQNPDTNEQDSADWAKIKELINTAIIDLRPVTTLDPLSKENQDEQIDFQAIQTAKIIRKILRGEVTFDTLPLSVDVENVKMIAAKTIIEFDAMDIVIPDTMWQFMISAFIKDVQDAKVELI